MPGASEAVEKIAGEWIISASIMQCEGSIFGKMHFTDNGQCVYLAGAADLIGRGVGYWMEEGPIVGFEVSVYQYEAATTTHLHSEPHRFRGVAKLPEEAGNWMGEWYFCPFRQPPRLVGRFQAQRKVGGALPQLPPRALGDIPESAKKEVFKKLESTTELPFTVEPKWQSHRIPSNDIADVFYVPNWFEPKQAEEFLQVVDRHVEWEQMSTRRSQEFGAGGRCACGRSLMREPLPQWQSNIVNAFYSLGIFHPVLYPANSIRINAYDPGQGIHPHCDGPVYFPRAAMINLGSPCLFDFYSRLEMDEEKKRSLKWDKDKDVPLAPELPPGTKPAFSLLLAPGSLLVFSGDAFVHHRHGVLATERDEIGPHVRNAKQLGLSVGDSLERTRRVSITVRHLLPRCVCSPIG